ncbi:hypothetical protein OAI40_05935, partial [Candidatus Pseudothioglobus singularis]
SYLSKSSSLFPVDDIKDSSFIVNNINNIVNNKEKFLLFTELITDTRAKSENLKISKPTIPSTSQANELPKHIHIVHNANGSIELYNLLPFEVTVKNILFNGKALLDNEIVIDGISTNHSPTVIKTEYTGIRDEMFTAITEYMGNSRRTKNGVTIYSDQIHNPLLIDNWSDFNFIRNIANNSYEIREGLWTVNKPIIIEGNLRILSGANINFSEDAYLIIKGALIAKGSKNKPIIFDSILDSWKGIYVLNADKKSKLTNVYINNVTNLSDGILNLTGGVNFYNSDVEFNNVKVISVKAEDAINFVKSEFLLNSVLIDSVVSDGIDSDFSDGIISNSKFANVGGDAMDFSGSRVLIENSHAINIYDKAVSAGEGSLIKVENSFFENTGVGIASKDGSEVNVKDTNIFNYTLFAGMSYLKKSFYDPPSITFNNCLTDGKRPYIRQIGTNMLVDFIDVPESDLSVTNLYQSGVMAK